MASRRLRTTRSTRRCRSTRCISARGAAANANRLPTYREIAQPLAEYARDQGFTHVELMPVTEHPFYGSWGYQTTGYFAPTARYGDAAGLHVPRRRAAPARHRRDPRLGAVALSDRRHGLAYFDGTHLYEHADPRQGFHPEWNSSIFNYDRNEVRAFLLSSALFWLDRYHVDGLRVDAVASMLYLDYGRKDGEWIPNVHGGRENLGAIQFLRHLNESVYRDHPDVQMIAEESTAWPMVSRPVYVGGLGFGMKWNMGWMHDTLDYLRQEPIYRKYHHDRLTFSIWYAFFENFVLALSHDEVVHGKGSLIGKMPGDTWQQFANLRLLYGYMWGHPGKKLLFMGGEFGQRREWTHEGSLEWWVLAYPEHAGMQRWVADLNALYRAEPALHELDFDRGRLRVGRLPRCGRERRSASCAGPASGAPVLVVCNFTPVPRTELHRRRAPRRILARAAEQRRAASTAAAASAISAASRPRRCRRTGASIRSTLTLPPLATLFFKPGSALTRCGDADTMATSRHLKATDAAAPSSRASRRPSTAGGLPSSASSATGSTSRPTASPTATTSLPACLLYRRDDGDRVARGADGAARATIAGAAPSR